MTYFIATFILGQVIEGKVGLSWSQHVRAWALPLRTNTIIVRYEHLAAGNSETLNAISSFIGEPLLQKFDIPFDGLNRLQPAFFRRGSDRANIAEMDAESRFLFEQHHGDMLRAMGYGGAKLQNDESDNHKMHRYR